MHSKLHNYPFFVNINNDNETVFIKIQELNFFQPPFFDLVFEQLPTFFYIFSMKNFDDFKLLSWEHLYAPSPKYGKQFDDDTHGNRYKS